MKLARALSNLLEALRRQQTSFAVVGGLAASARGEARFTRDVDVAVDADAEAEALVFALKESGYTLLATVGKKEPTGSRPRGYETATASCAIWFLPLAASSAKSSIPPKRSSRSRMSSCQRPRQRRSSP